jgi:hypothetical protein
MSTKDQDDDGMNIAGSCHCGNISYSLEWPDNSGDIPARACGCTFCVKHGGVWTSHPQGGLRARVTEPGMVARYTFRHGNGQFPGVHALRCCAAGDFADRRCHVCRGQREYFDGVDRSRIRSQPATFDGEDVQSRLDRRRRNWIADVVLAEGGS